MYRLISKLSSKSIPFYSFSSNKKPYKNITEYIKTKQSKNQSTITPNQQVNIYQLSNAHKLLLYSPFFPVVLIAMPIVYYMQDPLTLQFIASCNLLQYYCSGLLFYNSFFIREHKNKIFPILMTVALSNCISGPYSLITPVILGLTNLYIPFTDQKYHETQSEQNQQNIKLYMKVQGLFYFLLIFLVTVKFYHYISIRQIQTKLKKYEEENKNYQQKMIL